MSKTRTITLLPVFSLLLLSGCSWLSRKPHGLDSDLLAVMQKPATAVVEATGQQAPLRVSYELKHKPLRGEKLLIALEIKPDADIANSAYAVKVPEAIKLDEPQGITGLGSLKTRETYNEEVWLTPVNEGLYDVEVFFVTKETGQETKIKTVKIPISIGGDHSMSTEIISHTLIIDTLFLFHHSWYL